MSPFFYHRRWFFHIILRSVGVIYLNGSVDQPSTDAMHGFST
jgi:hypothetical protein